MGTPIVVMVVMLASVAVAWAQAPSQPSRGAGQPAPTAQAPASQAPPTPGRTTGPAQPAPARQGQPPPAPAPNAPAPAGQAAPAPAGQAAPAPAGQAAPAPASTATPTTGFTYNPEGRRDPFVSLIRRGSGSTGTATTGIRPAGLAGLDTSEVTLKGTVQSQTGFVGILQGSDNRTYIVRPGDKLFDGTVRSISQNVLVILQQVNDPLSLEKQREVRKVLRQTDERK